MKKFIVLGLLLALFQGSFAQNRITAQKFASRIDVYVNGFLFTSYHFKTDEKYPFFFPVNGPSNASITSMRNANFPHHSSLFFGCDKVNENNFWQESLSNGQIVSVREEIQQDSVNRLTILNECIWRGLNASEPIKDFRKITLAVLSKDLYQIDFDITMEMLTDVTIQKTNHSLFSARLDPDLSVINGGTMINAEGNRSEKDTFGKKSAWMDCSGKRDDKVEGLTIMQHPSNKWYPSPWFTRDYGFFSPTPMYWPKDETIGTKLAKGEKVALRYRVLVHSGNHETAKIAELFEKYKKE
jgi:hypothetical protein